MEEVEQGETNDIAEALPEENLEIQEEVEQPAEESAAAQDEPDHQPIENQPSESIPDETDIPTELKTEIPEAHPEVVEESENISLHEHSQTESIIQLIKEQIQAAEEEIRATQEQAQSEVQSPAEVTAPEQTPDLTTQPEAYSEEIPVESIPEPETKALEELTPPAEAIQEVTPQAEALPEPIPDTETQVQTVQEHATVIENVELPQPESPHDDSQKPLNEISEADTIEAPPKPVVVQEELQESHDELTAQTQIFLEERQQESTESVGADVRFENSNAKRFDF